MIGNPEVFAVQLNWDRKPTFKPWMHGVFCVHICGERLGSPWNQATLNGILAELDGWKPTIRLRQNPALMAADPVTAFPSIEDEAYGLEHLEGKLPPGFTAIPVPSLSAFEILGVDGLDDHRIYCVEDDATSRLLYARMGGVAAGLRLPSRFGDAPYWPMSWNGPSRGSTAGSSNCRSRRVGLVEAGEGEHAPQNNAQETPAGSMRSGCPSCCRDG